MAVTVCAFNYHQASGDGEESTRKRLFKLTVFRPGFFGLLRPGRGVGQIPPPYLQECKSYDNETWKGR